ncbi:class I SAM-dependent methyltransferase [Sphingomonas sp. NBWT7]|uniref:class I SAM-dependent methyltransferase n=1 Tax=Sphingomonas sp. NBWT7 TaxID=2596913 RepID=UPI00162467BE|nr:class I SAM-dependent methyltransferase [Sphingomonas sp. NBWT7]QNE30833.1 class I SAM-dependent methyltransferase [Sphingomonas sp. NBWT7]
MRHAAIATVLLASAAALGAAPAAPKAPSGAVAAALKDPQRSAANRARDVYRHPAETLAFFGVKPGDTVVEFVPGGGWYTEILAPMVKDKGRYVALVPSNAADRTKTMLAGKQAWFGPTAVATIDPATGASTVPAGSADVVLTFRNVHNLLMNDNPAAAPGTFAAFYAALKPGGVLGIVDHRLPETMDTALEKKSGYIKRSTVVRLAEAAGFKLAGESQINANPKDTHDHPGGVWTLPPTFALKDVDRAKYAAIGESDRFTLKFVKPK